MTSSDTPFKRASGRTSCACAEGMANSQASAKARFRVSLIGGLRLVGKGRTTGSPPPGCPRTWGLQRGGDEVPVVGPVVGAFLLGRAGARAVAVLAHVGQDAIDLVLLIRRGDFDGERGDGENGEGESDEDAFHGSVPLGWVDGLGTLAVSRRRASERFRSGRASLQPQRVYGSMPALVAKKKRPDLQDPKGRRGGRSRSGCRGRGLNLARPLCRAYFKAVRVRYS